MGNDGNLTNRAAASAPSPASDFDRALRITFGFEGGVSNHAADRGGLTNLGVTQRTYNAFCRQYGRPVKSVSKLSHAEAREVYELMFWKAPGFDRLPWPFCMLAFDAGVNSGQSRGAKWVQEGLGVAADGRIGPKTVAAAQAAIDNGDGAPVMRCVEIRARFLANLCQRDKSQIAFVEGWWVRTLTVLGCALVGEA